MKLNDTTFERLAQSALMLAVSEFFRLRQGGNERLFLSFWPQAAKTKEKDSLSMLPQAKHAPCGASNHATA